MITKRTPADYAEALPDYRIDELLSHYTRSSPYQGYTRETKRNYITDLCLFLNFLWQRGKVWTQAVESDGVEVGERVPTTQPGAGASRGRSAWADRRGAGWEGEGRPGQQCPLADTSDVPALVGRRAARL